MIIRTMGEEDLSFVVACTTREGWLGETIDVFRAFLRYDPSGCLIAEENDRRIGMCIAVSYGSYGFLGELIVVEECRGRGVGRRVLERSINYLQDRGCRGIYLDGDAPAVPLYERIGFRHVCKSLRFLGRIRGRRHDHVEPMSRTDMDAVCSMDRAAFGADRRFFLEYRLEHFPRLCKTLVEDGLIVGFIMGQPGHEVVSVGPWVMRDHDGRPIDLLEGLAAETGDDVLRLGVLSSNSRAVGALQSVRGLGEAVPSWRMVHGIDGKLGGSEQLYAIGSAAKG